MSNINPLQNNVDDAQSNIIIYNTIDGKAAVALYARNGKIWFNQKQMADFFATTVSNINMHISNVLKDRKDFTLDYWRTTADGVLVFNGKDVLQGKGGVSNEEMESSVNAEYQKFDSRRKVDDADALMLEEIIAKTKSLE